MPPLIKKTSSIFDTLYKSVGCLSLWSPSMKFHLSVVLLALSFAHSITVFAESDPEQRYDIYLSAVEIEKSVSADGISIENLYYHTGGLKSTAHFSVDNGIEQKRITYSINGTVEKVEDNLNKTQLSYAINGLTAEAQNLRPLLSQNVTTNEFVYGIREAGNKKLYPANLDVSSFDSARYVTGEYFFYPEARGVGPYLKVNYKHGILDGPIEGYFESGAKMFEANMSAGILDGSYVRYDDPSLYLGQGAGKFLKEEGTYVNGVLHGKLTTYKDRKKWLELVFNQGNLDGEISAYSTKNHLLEKCTFSNNSRVGRCKIHNEANLLLVDANYTNGLRDGPWMEWYPNGKDKKQAVYKNGLLNGEVLTFLENGQISKKESYKANKLDGPSSHYNSKGGLKAVAEYKDNKKEGFVTIYYTNGKVELQIPYKSGLRHGVQKKYYDSGELFEIAEFKQGRQVGMSQSFYKTGVSMGGGGNMRADKISYLDHTALVYHN